MRLVARGPTKIEIAGKLFIGDATVKTHVPNIRMKLDLCDRVQVLVGTYKGCLVYPGMD